MVREFFASEVGLFQPIGLNQTPHGTIHDENSLGGLLLKLFSRIHSA